MRITTYTCFLFLVFLILGALISGCSNQIDHLPQVGNGIGLETVSQLQYVSTLGEGQALEINFASNGRWAAIKSTTGVYLYDAQTWLKLDFDGLQKQANQMAFSPDGNLYALAIPALHEIQIWRLPELQLVGKLTTEQSTVLGLIFTPQGDRLISSSFQTVNVWRVDDGTQLQTFKAPQGTEFRQVSLSADGLMLGTMLFGKYVNTVLFWQLGNEGPVAEFKESEESWLSAGKFLPAGDRYGTLVSESNAGGADKLLVWHPLDGRIVLEIEPSTDVTSGVWLFEEGQNLLVSGHADGEVIFWSSDTGKVVMTLSAPIPASVQAIQIDSTGSRLVSVYSGGYIGLWSLPDGKLERIIEPEENEKPAQIIIQPDGQRLIGIMSNGRTRVWDLDEGQEISILEDHATGEVRTLAFSPDGRLLAAGLANGLVHLWQTNNDQKTVTVLDHKARVDSVAFSPDGLYLVTGVGERISSLVFDDTIRVWDWNRGSLIWQFAGEQEIVPSCTVFRNRVAFSPDGSLLAVTSHDFAVQIWDMRDRTLRDTLIGHTQPVLDMTISSDGSTLASTSLDGTIRLWRLSDGTMRRILEAEPLGMVAVAFSPDGRLLAGGSLKGELYLWEADSGRMLRKLNGKMNTLSNLVFSVDGSLVSAGKDSNLNIWSTKTGELVAVLPGEGGNILNVAFSRDGSLLAFGSDRGNIQLWQAP